MEHLRLSLFSILLFIVFSLQAKTIYYVKTDGAGDGSSWSSAANNIQTMIDKAVSGDEVWVAKGTYYPTTETIARDARSRTFSVKSGVNLYGGFAGSESLVSQRALADLNLDNKINSYEFVNSTILSGNIDGVADVWTKTMNTDGKTWKWTVTGNEGNCYNVVTAISKIDGFFIIGGNANLQNHINEGGGVNSTNEVTNCTVSNCYADYQGGGISTSSSVNNCYVSNCSASSNGGGIYSSSYSSSYSSVNNCTVSNCYANSGGGVYSNSYSSSSTSFFSVSNCSVSTCAVSNCSASYGGGILSSTSTTSSTSTSSSVSNCTISNCSASSNGGGIFSSSTTSTTSSTSSTVSNCTVSNCYARTYGGGIYSSTNPYSYIKNCASSNNNTNGIINIGITGGTQTGCMSPDITITYNKPTSFIGIATTDAQKSELLTADWHLKESSPCINAGTSTGVSATILTGTDLDNNPRVLYGTIDIGAYEYTVPKIQIPLSENYNNITSWNNSLVFYNSNHINGGQNIMWSLTNQKADFSWQTNLITTYSQPIFTYQIDGTKSSKIYLKYDMYFQAYAGTISPLGTEKLNVEFSTDLVTWSTIATYSNANGTIANQTYKHDISALAAGKTFFIRFNANGANSNRIEKWEIDNVIIDTDVTSAVEVTKADKLLYSINDSKLSIRNIEQGAYVQLFDTNGKLVDSAKANSNTLDFNLPIHGVYILKASSESGVTSRKVVL